MAGRMMLVKTLPEPDYLHTMQANGLVRASMTVAEGPHEGIALRTESMAMGNPCQPGTLCYTLWELLAGPISWAPPLANITFATLLVENGKRRAWGEAVRAYSATLSGDDHYLAAAHAFGPEPYNAVVEVMANDVDLMHEILLAVTDIAGVEHVELHSVAPGDTRGMGSRPA